MQESALFFSEFCNQGSETHKKREQLMLLPLKLITFFGMTYDIPLQ
jgi:hypothetical protein